MLVFYGQIHSSARRTVSSAPRVQGRCPGNLGDAPTVLHDGSAGSDALYFTWVRSKRRAAPKTNLRKKEDSRALLVHKYFKDISRIFQVILSFNTYNTG